jgi:hypothetical protein
LDFHREIEELRKLPGGFSGASHETLARLDDTAYELRECSRDLVDYGKELLDRFGESGDATDALVRTSRDLRSLVSTYYKESGQEGRARQRVEQQSKELAGIKEELESGNFRLPDAKWATSQVNSDLGSYPGLKMFLVETGAPRINQNTPRESITAMIHDLVQPHGGKVDEGWKDIAPGLGMLDSYAKLEDDWGRFGGSRNVESFSDRDLETLRDRARQAINSSGQLARSVDLIREHYQGREEIPLARLGKELDMSVEHVKGGAGQMLEMVEAELQKRRPPDHQPRLPDIAWARRELKDRLEAFPSMHRLAFDTDVGKKSDVRDSQTVTGLVRRLMHKPFKEWLPTQQSGRELRQNLDKLDERWKDVEGSLRSLDRFADLQREVRQLGPDGLKTLPPKQREDLRQRAQDAYDAAPQLNQAINLHLVHYEGSESVPIDAIRDAIDDAVRRMMSDADVLMQALDGKPPSEVERPPPTTIQPPPPETVPTQTISIQETAEDKSLNPFDDGDDDVSASSTNPFDNEVEEPKQSTNPFDDDFVGKSTNPFDDDVAPPKVEAPRTEPPRTEPRLTFKQPTFEDRLHGYPSLQELADKTKISSNGSMRTMTSMLSDLVLEPETRHVHEDLRGERHAAERTQRLMELEERWKRVSDGIGVLDAFAEIRLTTSQMTPDDWARLGPDDRRELRTRTEQAFEKAAKISEPLNVITNEMRNARKVVPTRDITDAFYATGARIREESQAILARLDELDRTGIR